MPDCDQKDVEGHKCDHECSPMVMPEAPYGGATSWDELDSYLELAHSEGMIAAQLSQANLLIGNIMSNKDLTIDDRAALLKGVASKLAGRVANPPEYKGLLEKVKAVFSGQKIVWTAAYVNNLPDSAFAYIESGSEKDADGKTVPRSTRHFPHHNANGALDMPHLRNALARAPQSPFGDDAKAHLETHAKAENIGGRELPVSSSFVIAKDKATGAWRWVALASNKFVDREGELFPEAAHKEFVEYVDGTKSYPELWLWHMPGMPLGSADFVEYLDGFLVVSGTVEPEFGDVAESLSKDKELAVSHGYFYADSDLQDGIYRKYRMFEVSPLPREKAANLWTAFSTIVKEDQMMSKEKRAFLVTHLGEERVAGLEVSLPRLSKELEDKGISWKDVEFLAEKDEIIAPAAGEGKVEVGDSAEGASGDDAAPAAADIGEQSTSSSDEIVKAFATVTAALGAVQEQVSTLAQNMEGIQNEIKELKRSDDEKLVNLASPKRPAPDGTGRPSGSPDNAIPEDLAEKIKSEGEETKATNPAQDYLDDLIKGPTRVS